ncbi:hypothetical protein J5226_16770 [Lysobacter sp. K5869]|uniref:hypothetical protein n=1 Tax=Lysobacter sp. K5869 TaxID=2820808 RepID=UPI001C060292|nr:hypothetical protein [Lysobacter sp. K5869]QWP75270.1 hypothetical protein J5226_16770 [Lysobacter sp. K5869]
MTVGRLRGLLWRDELELQRKGFASRRAAEERRKNSQLVKVVVVDLADYRCNGLAAS